nr:hypothetical protein [Candidatus Freyarchaeota archaeon]
MSETPPTAEQVKKDKELLKKLQEEKKKELEKTMAEGKAKRAAAMKDAASKLEPHIGEKATKKPLD